MTKEKRICPKCGKEYVGYPAISRDDNKTEICPNCGTREALDRFGMSEKEREKIVEAIPSEKEN